MVYALEKMGILPKGLDDKGMGTNWMGMGYVHLGMGIVQPYRVMVTETRHMEERSLGRQARNGRMEEMSLGRQW